MAIGFGDHSFLFDFAAWHLGGGASFDCQLGDHGSAASCHSAGPSGNDCDKMERWQFFCTLPAGLLFYFSGIRILPVRSLVLVKVA